MKPRSIRYHVQSARIYRHHYKPSYNILRLLRSVVSVLLHGSATAGSVVQSRHK